MKLFAIMDGNMFFQRLEPNEKYVTAGRAIQSDLHSYSEYTPIFGHDPKWYDYRTATGYIRGLIEDLRWSDTKYHAYALICKDEYY